MQLAVPRRPRRRARTALPVIALIAAPAALLPATADAAFGDRTLRKGMRGHDVRVLQDFLTRAGVRTAVDGEFGPGTVSRVKVFERRQRRTVDGVVTRPDAAVLRRIAERTPARSRTRSAGTGRHLGDRILKRGMKGQDVRVLQDFLTRSGHPIRVDGSFGARTVKVVKGFQADVGLTPDGVVEQRTVAALRQSADTGGAGMDFGKTAPTTSGSKGKIRGGLAIAPADAPDEVKAIIAAGNEIATKPYVYGGGHGKWKDRGYDCSGSVSYALHGAGLLDESMPSGDFERWEKSGRGEWVTIYANGGHMYMVVAGLRFDTSGASGRGGSRWTTEMRGASGFRVRHPNGL